MNIDKSQHGSLFTPWVVEIWNTVPLKKIDGRSIIRWEWGQNRFNGVIDSAILLCCLPYCNTIFVSINRRLEHKIIITEFGQNRTNCHVDIHILSGYKYVMQNHQQPT